jgi:hypothetical protein
MIKKVAFLLFAFVVVMGVSNQLKAYPSFQCTNPPYDQVVDPSTGKIYGKSTNTCECCQNNNYNPTGCTQDVRVKCNSAPINSSLILLIVAGVGLGGFLLYRNKENLMV